MLLRRGQGRSKRPEWLMFKLKDDTAASGKAAELTTSKPLSVSTGRSLDEIAGDADRVWGPGGEKKRRTRAAKKQNGKSPGRGGSSRSAARTKRTRKVTAPPRHVALQLATLAKEPPAGDDWLHEIKFDGYRMLCRVANGKADFETRNHQDWTRRFPTLAAAAEKLPVTSALVDGEVVVLDNSGKSDFQLLQAALHDAEYRAMVYEVFDLLFLDGEDLRPLPLEERKARMRAISLARRPGRDSTERSSGGERPRSLCGRGAASAWKGSSRNVAIALIGAGGGWIG